MSLFTPVIIVLLYISSGISFVLSAQFPFGDFTHQLQFEFFELYSYKGMNQYFYALSISTFFVAFLFTIKKVKFDTALFTKVLSTMIISGLLMRVFALYLPAFTSDINRYISDGTLLANGLNPYSSPPLANVAFKSGALYPVLIELLFALIVFLKGGFMGLKIIIGLFELAFASFITVRAVRCKSKHWQRLALFVWLNPFFINEFWKEAHLDIISVFFLAGSIFMWRYSRDKVKVFVASSAIFNALSVAVKFHGLILWPWYALDAYRKKIILKKSTILWIVFLLVVSTAVILPTIIFVPKSNQAGLQMYSTYWTFGQPLFYLFRLMGLNQEISIKILQFSIIILCTIIFFYYLLTQKPLLSGLLQTIFVILLLFPVQHPWYYVLAMLPAIFSKRYSLFSMTSICVVSCNYILYPLLGL